MPLAAAGQDGNGLQLEKIEAKLFKLFPGALKNIDIDQWP